MMIGKGKKDMIHNMEEAYELVYGKKVDDKSIAVKEKAAWLNETINNNTTKGE